MMFYYINSELEATDRYDLAKFLEYDNGYNVINSYFLSELKKLPAVGTYSCLDDRPDTVSYKVYNDTQFWWIILVYNGIVDWTDGSLSAGKIISYPSLSRLEALIFTLKAKSRAIEAE